MTIDQFDFELPTELIAQEPLTERDHHECWSSGATLEPGKTRVSGTYPATLRQGM
jgi:S-adenosylmethionine:tRNA-ribosyltransferase-isomerase (queuine synthetase)